MNPPVIDMNDVAVASMKDPDALVVEAVNWTVGAGDYWVVAGLQGSGKSDFLLLTAGLMPPQRGTYRLFGEAMPIFEDARLAHRLRLGLVFDGGQLFNQLTVWDNVALPLRYHQNLTVEEAREQVKTILDLTELTPWTASTPGGLSRNWRKRVGLARALVLRPEVLLLDNPIGGLDLRHRNWWLNFLDQLSAGHSFLAGRRVTLAATAEDLRPWRERAHQFAILKEKRLLVLGTRSQLAEATDALVKELLASAASHG